MMSLSFSKSILTLGCVFSFLQIANPVAAQVRLVGNAESATDGMRINDNGAVVGGILAGQYFIFEKNAYRSLPLLLTPRDINNSNEVVGTELRRGAGGDPQYYLMHMFRVNSSGESARLASSVGYAPSQRLNAAGEVGSAVMEIVDPMNPWCMRGNYFLCPVRETPALFGATGGISRFRHALPDELWGGVGGINNNGDIVGPRSIPGPVTQAYRKRRDADVELLPTLGGSSGEALAINDLGVTVGQAQDQNGNFHAFRYDSAITDLGTLGGATSKAQGINNLGHIVGTSQTAAGENRAFLIKAGVMTDLNSFVPATRNLTLISATDINEFQEISGVAQRVGTSQYVGYRFSFVETTVAAASRCRRVGGDRTVLRRNQQCRFSGTLTNFRGRRLPNRTVLFQYAAQKAGPWVGLALARTDRFGQYRKSLSLRNTGYYRALGPISDATLPMVPSGQIQVR